MKSLFFHISFISIILFLSVGCKESIESTPIFLSGEIINPKSQFVILMKDDNVIDSFPLNQKNSFTAKLNITPGLYSFKHGYEFQYLYLDENDSLRIRLNTWDFDETLSFEGQGADRNELLLDLFLDNEIESSIFYSYFLLPEQEFQEKIDLLSLKLNKRIDLYLKSEPNASKNFKHFAEAAAMYPVYRLKEIYPYFHKLKNELDSIAPLTSTYYDYRKNIDINDPSLTDYYAFQNYVVAYLYNLAYAANDENMDNAAFHDKIIQTIHQKVKLPSLKNRLLSKEMEGLIFNHADLLNKKHWELFEKYCENDTLKKKFKELKHEKNMLKENALFPDFEVMDSNGSIQQIQDLIQDQNALICFTTSSQNNDKILRNRIDYLQKKFPNLKIISLNSEFENTTPLSDSQYFLTQNSEGHQYISKIYPRTILINKNGLVERNFLLITKYHSEKSIEKMLRQ